jgi:hypothetical protein
MNFRQHRLLLGLVLCLLLIQISSSGQTARGQLAATASVRPTKLIGPRISLSGKFYSFYFKRISAQKLIFNTSLCDTQGKLTRVEFPGVVRIPHELHDKWVTVMGHHVIDYTRSTSGYTYFEGESIEGVHSPVATTIATSSQPFPIGVSIFDFTPPNEDSFVVITGFLIAYHGDPFQRNELGTPTTGFPIWFNFLGSNSSVGNGKEIPLLFRSIDRDRGRSGQWVKVTGYYRVCYKAIEVSTITEATPTIPAP